MIRRALAVTAATTTLAVLGVQPAAQASSGCSYPQVCVYRSSQTARPSARYRDVTTGWQWLGRSRGSAGLLNTRHDDVVFVLDMAGDVHCVPPRTRAGFWNGIAAIRISYINHCRRR